MPITNSEKQARFRKKQELKKFKDQVFKEWQLGRGFSYRRENPDEIHALLEKAASLPSGWNKEDFERAWRRISQLRFDFVSPRDALAMDVMNGAGLSEEFVSTSDPGKLVSDTHESISKTRALASYLIYTLERSTLSSSEQAAAVMETLRHVGRSAASSGDMAKSDAMIICQASLPNYYNRPDWFLDSISKWLANRLDDELVHELGKRFADFQKQDK